MAVPLHSRRVAPTFVVHRPAAPSGGYLTTLERHTRTLWAWFALFALGMALMVASLAGPTLLG